jgi:hypothetical protein
VPQDHSSLPAVIPSNGVETYRMSTNAADICRAIVTATAKMIEKRRYVCVEGWQAIAVAHGCAASARNVERVEGGFRAVGEVRRMSDGVVIAEAEGFVGEDEPVWFGGEGMSYGKPKTYRKRPDYAIRAMTQTRAISRACRSAFAHVVVMIDSNLSTTPAEEIPDEGFHVDGPGSSWGAGGKEAAIDQARADGLMDNAPAKKGSEIARDEAKVQRLKTWIKNMEGTLQLSGQTAESIKELWDDPKDLRNHDDASEILPAEYQALVQLAIAARKAAAARTANTMQAG